MNTRVESPSGPGEVLPGLCTFKRGCTALSIAAGFGAMQPLREAKHLTPYGTTSGPPVRTPFMRLMWCAMTWMHGGRIVCMAPGPALLSISTLLLCPLRGRGVRLAAVVVTPNPCCAGVVGRRG